MSQVITEILCSVALLLFCYYLGLSGGWCAARVRSTEVRSPRCGRVPFFFFFAVERDQTKRLMVKGEGEELHDWLVWRKS